MLPISVRIMKSDIEIARSIEPRPIIEIAEKAGIHKDEPVSYTHLRAHET